MENAKAKSLRTSTLLLDVGWTFTTGLKAVAGSVKIPGQSAFGHKSTKRRFLRLVSFPTHEAAQ